MGARERTSGGGRGSAERDLVRLVYSSTACPSLTAADLVTISEQARRNNQALGVTGLLLHQGQGFYSVLEGNRRKVFERMEAIATDPRHGGLDILREEAIAARRFVNWSFLTLPARAAVPGEPEVAVDFIRSLSRRL